MRYWILCGLMLGMFAVFAARAQITEEPVGSTVAPKQESSTQLPCEFSDALLRTDEGEVVHFSSDEMKSRAIHKVDVGTLIQKVDISGTAVVDVIVGPDGHVHCMQSRTGHPLIRAEVLRALQSWIFKRAEMDGRPVGYLGRLEFRLCNINCGDLGPSMTLLE